jgi:hypothetical protein
LPTEEGAAPGAVIATDSALGNGRIDFLEDVVYVMPEAFDADATPQMALELEQINRSLVAERRRYLLIGFGRWGTSDPWCGIPVNWSQISNAQVIVEAALPGAYAKLSQGTHFFHNMISFEVLYFSVNLGGAGHIDWPWFERCTEVTRLSHVRHVRTAKPLSILVDGRKGHGLILPR